MGSHLVGLIAEKKKTKYLSNMNIKKIKHENIYYTTLKSNWMITEKIELFIFCFKSKIIFV